MGNMDPLSTTVSCGWLDMRVPIQRLSGATVFSSTLGTLARPCLLSVGMFSGRQPDAHSSVVLVQVFPAATMFLFLVIGGCFDGED